MTDTRLKAIIVDIDGTLANNDHRTHFVSGPEKNWEAFHNGIGGDVPHEWCVDLVWKYWDSATAVFFVTGRHEKYREATKKFLDEKCDFVIKDYQLLMRKDDDRREDYIIKQEIYETHIKDKYQVLFALDDRQQVVDMWRRLGITCLQCAKGDF